MGIAPVSPNSRVWLDQFQMSGFVQGSEFSIENTLADAGNFAASGPRMVPTNYGHSHNLTMLWSESASNDDGNNMDHVAHSLAGSSDGLHYLAETRGASGLGAVVTESIVKLARKPISGSKDGLYGLNIDLAGAGEVSRGKVVGRVGATATGTYASQTQSTYPAGTKYQAVFRVLDVVGSSWSITLDVEGSSNGTAWTTMDGLSQVISSPGVFRITSTAAEIKPFVRGRASAINVSTATPSIPIVITAGVVEV